MVVINRMNKEIQRDLGKSLADRYKDYFKTNGLILLAKDLDASNKQFVLNVTLDIDRYELFYKDDAWDYVLLFDKTENRYYADDEIDKLVNEKMEWLKQEYNV